MKSSSGSSNLNKRNIVTRNHQELLAVPNTETNALYLSTKIRLKLGVLNPLPPPPRASFERREGRQSHMMK
jgi:hypothetical protein